MNINTNPGYGIPGAGMFGGQGLGSGMQSQAMLMMMMQWLSGLLGMFMGGGGMPMAGNFGASSGDTGLTSFLGAPASAGGGLGNSYGGGGFGGGYTGDVSGVGVNPGLPGASGTGQAAVDLARRYIGRDSISLKGDMPHFTAAGGVTNNCVDFVSSALESQGLVKGHHINVRSFEQQLRQQGYRQIPASQAQPGDVWINHSRGHTELVASPGARTLIGSNGSARQKVTEHQNNPGSGVYYSRR